MVFWVHFGRLLGVFWGPKAVRNSMPFFVAFLGSDTERRDFSETSAGLQPTGLRRGYFLGGSPQGGALFARGEITERALAREKSFVFVGVAP